MLRSETAASPERRAAALAGLRRYQEAPRARRRMAPARFRSGPARLRDHGGDGRPVVFVPSLINPAFVLDIAPGRSLVRHMADAGFHAWLVDWGVPRRQDAMLDLGGHVARRLLPLIAKLDRPPILVGYCLGGTLALAAAALLGDRVAGVATIAAPWRFSGYGAEARDEMLRLWEAARAPAERMGVLPMEVLQSGFWRLDPARTVAKYAAFATMTESEAATFVALEDWANAGAPLTFGAARELFEDMIRDDTPASSTWRIGARTLDPQALACPAAEFVSLTDRITPAATAAGLAVRHELAAGHVGMVVGSKARAMLWEPLTEWLRAVP
jgi:polyhydroxyalkanoate synthase